jgi:hypothetical protein
MKKNAIHWLLILVVMFFSIMPSIAEEKYNAYACKEDGSCLDSFADPDFGVVTIYFNAFTYKTLQLEELDTGELFAMDRDENTYYEIDMR